MKRTFAAALVLAMLVLSFHSPAQETPAPPKMELPKAGPDGSISLFNGKDLTGWWGEMDVFRAENGEIVGQSKTGLKRNEFLKSRYEVSDFRLVLQMKLVPDEANSGVQFRSEPFKGHEMRGYQADAGKGWWGKLYEESARGMLVDKGGEQFVNKNDWNTYEIVAVGDHIMAALNGHKVIDFRDPAGRRSGLLALQVHAGGPTEVRWKDLKLWTSPKDELMTAKK